MKYVFVSRTGNVRSIIERLGLICDAIELDDGSEIINEDYILFTYTDGYGDTPYVVDEFLDHNGQYIKGVIVSGDKNYDQAYGLAGDTIADKFNCPLLYKVENEGTYSDIDAMKAILDLPR